MEPCRTLWAESPCTGSRALQLVMHWQFAVCDSETVSRCAFGPSKNLGKKCPGKNSVSRRGFRQVKKGKKRAFVRLSVLVSGLPAPFPLP